MRCLRTVAAGVLLAGCSTAALDGGAIVRPTCAPNDGPATQLTVPAATTADYPQLRVWVWRPLDELSGVRLTVPGDDGRDGNARWCRTDADCDQASATVAFGQVGADRSVDVSVDALLADGTRFRDARRAAWRPGTSALCG